MTNPNQFTDLLDNIDKKEFQLLQDNFAKALDLAFITVDYRGRPLFDYSGFTDFCQEIRKRPECIELCYQCDAHGGLHATITGEPHIYRCHAGIIDFAVPIVVEGKYMGSVMGGQVELLGSSPELKPIIPQKTDWQTDPALVEASKSIHKTNYDKLVASVYLMRDMMQNLMEKEYRTRLYEDMKRQSKALQDEKVARISLEQEVKGDSAKLYEHKPGNEFVFYMLNILARLAYKEGAEETERIACDFASIMRYINENAGNSFVTVGEEIEYIEYYLRVQKSRLADSFEYEINVPDEYKSIPAPFMLLQSVIDNAISYGIEGNQNNSKLVVSAREKDDILLITVSDDGIGMTQQEIHVVLEGDSRSSSENISPQNLTKINKMFKEFFGDSFGVGIKSREDGIDGTEVSVRLPLINNSSTVKHFALY